jgi:hypothetical protein
VNILELEFIICGRHTSCVCPRYAVNQPSAKCYTSCVVTSCGTAFLATNVRTRNMSARRLDLGIAAQSTGNFADRAQWRRITYILARRGKFNDEEVTMSMIYRAFAIPDDIARETAGDPPLNFLSLGGEEVGDIDVGYGPARIFRAPSVAVIHEALENFPDSNVDARLGQAADSHQALLLVVQ